MLTWSVLTRKKERTDLEMLLIQCIITISVHPNYALMTFEEIFNDQKKKLKLRFPNLPE